MSISQNLSIKIFVFTASIALLFALGFLVTQAQEAAIGVGGGNVDAQSVAQADAQATQFAALDENIKPEDLGVGDPNILPDSPLYGFKNMTRGFRSFMTRDPAKKAELKMEFANEKLIEAQKMSTQGKSSQAVKSAVESYEKEVGRVKTEVGKLQQAQVSTAKIERVVEKALDSQFKHNKALGKMMKENTDIATDIEQKKQEVMKNLTGSVASIVDSGVFQKKFEEAVQNQKGSAFKHFKNVEVLEEVKDFVPEQARGAIENAIKQSSKLFQEDFSAATQDQRKIFNKYVEKMGGNEVRQLEAFDSLNAFADIEKEMLGEMEKAREKARGRMEERMNGFKDETQRQVFIGHLENGRMEDARIVKELENNLPSDTITGILGIKHKMEEKMRSRFENAQSSGDLSGFFGEIEDRPDAQMLSVMKEIEAIIPADKKDFFQEMKTKAMTEMSKNIEQARQFGRADDQMRRMASLDPESMQVMSEFQDEFGGQFGFFEDMKREQASKISDRFAHFQEFAAEAQFGPQQSGGPDFSPKGVSVGGGFRPEDFFSKAEEFRSRIEFDPNVKSQMQQFSPGIDQHFQSFDTQRNRFFEEFVPPSSQESSEPGQPSSKPGFDIDAKIAEAEGFITKLTALVQNSPEGTPGLQAARSLLSNAQDKVAKAKAAKDSGNTGEAFGQGVSAVGNATNGIRKLESAGFETERNRYFDARDEVRTQFQEEGVAPSQINFDEFIKFERPKFEDFSHPQFFGPPPGFGSQQQGQQGQSGQTGTSQQQQSGQPGTGGQQQQSQFGGGFGCAQVLTPARDIRSDTCRTFNNACLPPGWKADPSCEGQQDSRSFQEIVKPMPAEESIDHSRLQDFTQQFQQQQQFEPFRQPFPSPAPTSGTAQPTQSAFPTHSPFPTFGQPTPFPTYQQPFPTYQQPSPTPFPTYKEPYPTYQQPTPTPFPTYKEPYPTYQQPSPTPFPTYTQPSPTPAPTYKEPYPTYQQPSPTPAPTYTQPSPTPAPTYQQPSPTPFPTYTQPSPTPAPTYQQPSPTPFPTYTQPSPTPAPTYKEPSPTYQQPSPTPFPTYTQPSPTPAPTYTQPPPSGSIFDAIKRLFR